MITTVEEFIQLRESDAPEEYHRACHEEIAETVLFEVITNYPDMIVWIIRNKTVPLHILQRLAEHPDSGIRAEVAMKRKLDVKLFEKLSYDEDISVRERVACNKKPPVAIIQRLSMDTCQLVADAARKRLKEIEIG
jgi:hypothetical protein